MLAKIATVIFLLNSVIHYLATSRVFDRPDGAGKKLSYAMLAFITATVSLTVLALYAGSTSGLRFSVALILMAISLLLFLSTCRANIETKLTPIYSTNTPVHLVTKGPYRFIRHPFYSAYLLNYVGIAVVSSSIPALLAVALVYGIYHHATTVEEQKFSHSPLADDYALYKRKAGRFLPAL